MDVRLAAIASLLETARRANIAILMIVAWTRKSDRLLVAQIRLKLHLPPRVRAVSMFRARLTALVTPLAVRLVALHNRRRENFEEVGDVFTV